MKRGDYDAAELGFRFQALMWSLAGLLLGVLLGIRYSLQTGGSWLLPVLVGGATVWAITYFGSLFLAEHAGRLVSRVYFSGGSTTPYTRQHSRAETLRVQGKFDEAERELVRAAEAFAQDRQPCLMLARMLRDDVGRPDDALRWFRAAIARPEQDGSATPALLREMAELCMGRMGEPQRALPFLARLARDYPASPLANWAADRMATIRAEHPLDDSA